MLLNFHRKTGHFGLNCAQFKYIITPLEGSAIISTANVTMQFGAKPLFENISAKFGDGNRYGLIGANGCGKSTFMKILSGELEASSGNVSNRYRDYGPQRVVGNQTRT